MEGRRFGARSVVLTAGTFLRGRIHIGTTTNFGGGRAGEAPALHLAEQLDRAGIEVSRFKTGTPPRIDGRSVDFAVLERQESEIEQFDYSWSAFWTTPRRTPNGTRHPQQLPCFITYLGHDGKQLIQDHIAQSAMYGGAISARGPRYCPSVEDKVVKFPLAERHQLFLEPEGHDTSEMYVNGLSTSLPAEVQLAILRTVPGLKDVRMTRAGYAIEYDFFPPTQLDSTLQVKQLRGLFFAGQVNGTTGYEEAAGQGVVAGINAALCSLGREAIVLGRETSYIGVLVDDLVHRGVDEPYRLFTSRSEFRLTVRQDNSLRRLSSFALERGMFTDDEARTVARRLAAEDMGMQLARSTTISPEVANEYLTSLGSTSIDQPVRLHELVKRQGVELRRLFSLAKVGSDIEIDAITSTELEIKYAGYFDRERVQADRLKRLGHIVLAPDLEYYHMRSLTHEARQKLATIRPQSLAQAASIPGVSPNDVQNLLIEVERRRRVAAAGEQ
jgi:tRNA uridine 5-carboxymethylaminomethyl modification enzyme